MSIKISFTHYMKKTRVMLLVIFEKFELVVFYLQFFSLLMSIGWFLRAWIKNQFFVDSAAKIKSFLNQSDLCQQ